MQLTLSEESRERIAKLLDVAQVTAHYGWIPFILYLGWTQSVPRPSLFKVLTPFPTA